MTSTFSLSAGVNAPAAPTNLVATLQTGPQVSLTWRDNATNETGFVVERSSDNGVTFTPLPTTVTPRNNTGNVTFVDTTVVPGTGIHVPGGGAQRRRHICLLEPGQRVRAVCAGCADDPEP